MNEIRVPEHTGPFYTADELAAMLKCTTETVWRKCRDLEWPHMELGRFYRFSANDIHEIQEIMRPKPVARKTRKRTAL